MAELIKEEISRMEGVGADSNEIIERVNEILDQWNKNQWAVIGHEKNHHSEK